MCHPPVFLPDWSVPDDRVCFTSRQSSWYMCPGLYHDQLVGVCVILILIVPPTGQSQTVGSVAVPTIELVHVSWP